MNAKDWQISEARRQDIARDAQRHQTAATVCAKLSFKQRVAQWMIDTGQQLLEDDDVIQPDVQRHMTT